MLVIINRGYDNERTLQASTLKEIYNAMQVNEIADVYSGNDNQYAGCYLRREGALYNIKPIYEE